MRDVTSFTELASLADCERKWAYKYRDREEGGDSDGRYLGRIMHDLCASWWIGGDAQERAEETLLGMRDIEAESGLYEKAAWLYDRYTRHYGKDRADGTLRVLATELRLQRPLPGSDVEVVTYIDQIVQLRGAGIWAVERKTMADWSRLETLEVDPQVSLVLWQLRDEGWPVRGLLYDAIRTYQWKPTQPTQAELKAIHPKNIGELGPDYTDRIKVIQANSQIDRPLEDSFQQHYLDRTTLHEAHALSDAGAGVVRRAMLGAGLRPMRNVSTRTCGQCDHKVRCWTELGFAQTFELADDVVFD
jgi:PD-(D/E)XK nuclease superfamily